jgi:hypothetical protein
MTGEGLDAAIKKAYAAWLNMDIHIDSDNEPGLLEELAKAAYRKWLFIKRRAE